MATSPTESLAHRLEGGHWLMFDTERKITGCYCGFPASEDDCGWGDSVVDHFEDVVRHEVADQIRALCPPELDNLMMGVHTVAITVHPASAVL